MGPASISQTVFRADLESGIRSAESEAITWVKCPSMSVCISFNENCCTPPQKPKSSLAGLRYVSNQRIINQSDEEKLNSSQAQLGCSRD